MNLSSERMDKACWFVMRDLKRTNARQPAYKLLQERNITVFTPMKWRLSMMKGKPVRREVPCIPDLLFVHDTRKTLDPIVESISTFQYRWVRNKFREPMVVTDADMERFIHAVGVSDNPKYYLPEEITPSMLNRSIRIVGGPLDGYEGTLLSVRGSKVKRLLVQLPRLLAVSVEVNPEYIRLVD